jgi:hypothetical protein
VTSAGSVLAATPSELGFPGLFTSTSPANLKPLLGINPCLRISSLTAFICRKNPVKNRRGCSGLRGPFFVPTEFRAAKFPVSMQSKDCIETGNYFIQNFGISNNLYLSYAYVPPHVNARTLIYFKRLHRLHVATPSSAILPAPGTTQAGKNLTAGLPGAQNLYPVGEAGRQASGPLHDLRPSCEHWAKRSCLANRPAVREPKP